MVMAEPSVVGAVIALLSGLGVSVAAIVYRMRSMERGGRVRQGCGSSDEAAERPGRIVVIA